MDSPTRTGGVLATGKRIPQRSTQPARGPLWAFCLRPLGICVRCIAVVVPLLLVAGGLLYLKLLSSPLTVPFLVDPITRALNAELHGLIVTVEDAMLHLSPRGGLEFRLKSVRVADAQDVPVAMAAFAGIELSWRAMWSGRIAPARIDLIEPRMLLAHDEQGNISISISEGPKADATVTAAPNATHAPSTTVAATPGPSPTQTAPIATSTAAAHFDIARSLAQMLARSRQSGEVASHLESIGLRDASVILDDRGRRHVWQVPEMRLGLAHRQKRSRLTLDATIQSGREPWTLSVRADEGQKSKTIPLSIKFDRLIPAELAMALPGISGFSGIESPLKGEAVIELTPEGDILEAKIDVAAGAGKVDVTLPDGSPLLVETVTVAAGTTIVETATVTLRFDGAARRLEIAAANVVSGSGALAFEGHLTSAPAAAPKPFLFELRGAGGSFLKPAGGAAIPIDRFRASGGVGGAGNAIELSEFTIKAGGAELTMNGRIGDDTALEGRIGAASIETLRAFWPVNLAPQHRARIQDSLIKGQLGSSVLFWVVEGVLRTSIFLGYLVLLSKIRDLRRVFEYHGAEHKVISCYEAGEELTPSRAQRYSRLHPRCGTSFLLIVMIMAIFVFAPVGLPAWWILVLTRILGVPLIAGLSFEVIRWAGRNRARRWVQAVMYPGLQLQRLTTREPDLDQLAVSIAALEAVLALETPGASAADLIGLEVVA